MYGNEHTARGKGVKKFAAPKVHNQDFGHCGMLIVFRIPCNVEDNEFTKG